MGGGAWGGERGVGGDRVCSWPGGVDGGAISRGDLGSAWAGGEELGTAGWAGGGLGTRAEGEFRGAASEVLWRKDYVVTAGREPETAVDMVFGGEQGRAGQL